MHLAAAELQPEAEPQAAAAPAAVGATSGRRETGGSFGLRKGKNKTSFLEPSLRTSSHARSSSGRAKLFLTALPSCLLAMAEITGLKDSDQKDEFLDSAFKNVGGGLDKVAQRSPPITMAPNSACALSVSPAPAPHAPSRSHNRRPCMHPLVLSIGGPAVAGGCGA